ncbi:MAG: VanW family protein [Oscillospiraceae bacterium]|nr:VanW family protein [Oscillospiraceae bacterium]
MRNNPRKRNKKKLAKKRIVIPKPAIIVLCIILLLFFLSILFAILNLQNTKIIGGVHIEGIDVSNMSKSEAIAMFDDIIDKKLFNSVPFEYEGKDYEVELAVLNVNYNVNNVIDEAFKVGRSGNLFKDNIDILKTKLFGINYDLSVTYNKDKLDEQINQIYAQLPGIFISSSYYIENTNLILNKDVSGIVIKKDELVKDVEDYMENFSDTVSKNTIPVEIKEAQSINIADLHKEVYVEAKDAYYEKAPFKIYPEVEGIDFAISEEEVQKILDKSNTSNEYVIPLKITKPKITINNLNINAFPIPLETASSEYDVNNKNRVTNLELAAKKLNGYVLAPGEIFSYNKVVGARTIAEGYKEAPIYVGGKVGLGLGGGICQVSSMLYEASLKCNLKIIDRTNHQFLPSYAQAGLDATVVYGSIDYKFQNNRTYPIKISVIVNDGTIQVTFYGIAEASDDDKPEIETKILQTTPYKTQYINNPDLKKGTEEIVQSGANGIISETYAVSKNSNGETVEELISKDKYAPLDEIIEKN